MTAKKQNNCRKEHWGRKWSGGELKEFASVDLALKNAANIYAFEYIRK